MTETHAEAHELLRAGLPITLSVLYMEIARRLNLKIVGIGLPGHFVVQFVPATGDPQIIDVYDRGTPLTREAAEKKVLELSGRPAQAEHFQPMTKGAILSRMLQNLMGLARDAEDPAGMLRYVETMVALAPDSGSDRWYRAILRFQTGQKAGAQEDVEWLIQHSPEGIDIDRVRELGRLLERQP